MEVIGKQPSPSLANALARSPRTYQWPQTTPVTSPETHVTIKRQDWRDSNQQPCSQKTLEDIERDLRNTLEAHILQVSEKLSSRLAVLSSKASSTRVSLEEASYAMELLEKCLQNDEEKFLKQERESYSQASVMSGPVFSWRKNDSRSSNPS